MSDAPVGSFIKSTALEMIPLMSILVLILLTTMPVNFSHTIPIGGLWPLGGIVYWTLARPRSMKMSLIFLLGLLTDIVTFVPFGIHAAIFIIAQASVKRQRRFLIGQGFWVLWAAYALLAASVYTALFFVTSLFLSGSNSYLNGLAGVGVAAVIMPLITLCLDRLNHIIDLFDEPVA
jgi:rod shape-determining protein MreD